VGLSTEVGYQSNLQSPAPKIAVISAPLATQRGLIQIVGSTLTVTGISLNTVVNGRRIDFDDRTASHRQSGKRRIWSAVRRRTFEAYAPTGMR